MRLRSVMRRASRSVRWAAGAQRSWRSRKSSYARLRGQSPGSRSSGRSGSMNGKRRQAWTSAVWAANVEAVAARAQADEVLDELRVVVAQDREVPGLVDHLRRPAERAELRPEREQLRGLLDRDQRLAVHVRRDPQPAAQRAEPRPGQLRRQPVAELPPRLGHPQHEQQPAPVPAHRPAEPVDPPRTVAQQLRRARRQPHPRAPAHALALQPVLARGAHHRLPRRRRA